MTDRDLYNYWEEWEPLAARMTFRSLVAVLVLASCRVPGAASESDTLGSSAGCAGNRVFTGVRRRRRLCRERAGRIASNIRQAMDRRPDVEPMTVLNEAIFDSLGFERRSMITICASCSCRP